jgi:hypothetical protein
LRSARAASSLPLLLVEVSDELGVDSLLDMPLLDDVSLETALDGLDGELLLDASLLGTLLVVPDDMALLGDVETLLDVSAVPLRVMPLSAATAPAGAVVSVLLTLADPVGVSLAVDPAGV